MREYEVAVVGGGPAGLTTALYTTRLGHKTIVIDKGGGRCAMMADTHNVIGVTEDTSGVELIQTAKGQVQDHGGVVERGAVTDVTEIEDEKFELEVANSENIITQRAVLATGFNDKHPPSPAPRTARGLHYCLHCDAYMFIDEPVYVMGHGDSAAKVSMIMLNFTEDVDLLLRRNEPEWSQETQDKIDKHPINIIESEVEKVNNGDNGWLESLEFEDGERREYKGGFAMYGSNYNNGIAESLGCEINDDGTIEVDDHGKTNVNGVFAVGDVTKGHNQIPVRMGQGAKAGIQIHYDLREFPSEEDVDMDDIPSVSDIVRESK